jgi:hypothetical protein
MTLQHRHNALLGKPVADEILQTVRDGVAGLAAKGWPTKLVSITIGDVPAINLYVRNQARGAERAGILFEERNLPETVSRVEMLGILQALNTDPRVTGIIIQRPVPKHLNIKELQTAIHPLKDVEGMHPASIGNIVYRDVALAPCTAAASVELLKRTGLQLEGLNAVVIGHSEIVGKPIAFLLMAEGRHRDRVPSHDAQSRNSFARGGCGVHRGGQTALHHRLDDQAGCRGDRHRHQPDRGTGQDDHGGRRGLRAMRRCGGLDHAGAGRGGAGDRLDPDAQRADGGAYPGRTLCRRVWRGRASCRDCARAVIRTAAPKQKGPA